MKIRNIFAAVRLIAAFTVFVSTTASLAKTCQELPGDLQIISVEGSQRGNEFAMEYELRQENRVRLNEKAAVVCSESNFCVEEASIKTTFFFNGWTRVGYGSMTAVVNCLN